jgi:hypothetical protein
MSLLAVLAFAIACNLPASAGNIFLTGHDPDFHCVFQEGNPECDEFKIAFDLARTSAPDPTRPVLFLDQGEIICGDGCHHDTSTNETALAAGLAGIPITSYVVVDPTSAGFSSLPLTTDVYSAILIASDQSCGGCDNDQAGETAINSRAADIQAFFNAGGGLVYLAGANSTIYYNSVPSSLSPTPSSAAVTSIPFDRQGGFFLTPIGSALGLTTTDANCCFTHNAFSVPAGSPLQVAEKDSDSGAANPETLVATIGKQQPPSGPVATAVLTFPPGNNVSEQAVFNSDDPDPAQKHSIKITTNPKQQFSLKITATERLVTGRCDVVTGNANDEVASGNPDSFDCTLANFQGDTKPSYGSTTPPYTYPYFFTPGTIVNVPYGLPYSHGHAVDYNVEVIPELPPGTTCNTPTSSPCPWGKSFISIVIAWNADTTNVLFPLAQAANPGEYFNSPQLYDAPHDDTDTIDYPSALPTGYPYPSSSDSDQQKVFVLTSFYNPVGMAGVDGSVGTQPPPSGIHKPNHFEVAFPLATHDEAHLLVPFTFNPTSTACYFKGFPMFVLFQIEDESRERADPNVLTPPHYVRVAVLDQNGIFQSQVTQTPLGNIGSLYFLTLSNANLLTNTTYQLQVVSDRISGPLTKNFVVKTSCF